MYNFLCSDSLLYFFLFLSTLHSVYTRDCSCDIMRYTVYTEITCCVLLHVQALISVFVGMYICVKVF